MTFKTQHNQGFTLIETLIAIAILLVAVVGPINIMGGSLTQIYTARDQTLALSLAQEGIEIVRQKRDSNMLARWNEPTPTTSWDTDLGANWYTVDFNPSDTAIINISGVGGGPVYLDTNGFYRQDSSLTAKTKFTRVVKIENVGASPIVEKKVTSTVTWPVGNTTKTVELSESIFGISG